MDSSNSPASLTTRLGATIDYEQNHVRFFGDLILNLWDCGGQDAFMKSYLTTQKTTIFKDVGVLIYVFDVDSKHLEKDLEYYRLVLAALAKESEDAAVFVLIHKMDLARQNRDSVFSKKRDLIKDQELPFKPLIFGTSIYDESLYEVHLYHPRVLLSGSSVSGMVKRCTCPHTQLGRNLQTPLHLRFDVQRNRSRHV